MRILHTADWHLGRSFGDHRLLDDQERFLSWLVAVVEDEQVDLVAVAGDLYDRAVPPADAVALLRDTFNKVRAAGAEIVAIAGNHDGADRLSAYDGMTDASGVFIRGGYDRAGQVTIREFDDGPLAIVAVPFLDPQLAPVAYADELRAGPDGRVGRLTHEAVLAASLDAARAEIEPGLRSLVLAHAFVTGAEPSDSERELCVGGTGMVSASHFDGFSYTALGHLHVPQVVGDYDTVRYSGSPLPYSFSETHTKEIALIDLAVDGTSTVRSLPVPVGRSVVTLRSTFEELRESASYEQHVESFVRVELTDAQPIIDAHRLLRKRFPHLVEIAQVGLAGWASTNRPAAAEIRQLGPMELAKSFWNDMTGDDPTNDVQALLADALDEVDRRERAK